MAWTRAAALETLAEGAPLGVTCGGRRLALFRLRDGVFATSDVCPHAGASLSRGCLVGDFIECPVHFALFDIRTGAPDGSMTTRPIRTFPTRVEGGEVYVDVSDSEETPA